MQHIQISNENQALSHLDQQLLDAVSIGASNKHIALMLNKSEFTVRNRLSRVFKKINVANRAQAAVWYRDYAPQMPPMHHDADGETPVKRHVIQPVVATLKKQVEPIK